MELQRPFLVEEPPNADATDLPLFKDGGDAAAAVVELRREGLNAGVTVFARRRILAKALPPPPLPSPITEALAVEEAI